METPAEAARTAAADVRAMAAGSSCSASGSAAGHAAASVLVGLRFVLNLPPGFHFAPTDAELVVHFLRPRLQNKPLPLPIFIDERVLDYHPEQLIEKYRVYGEDRWFFFTRRERKHAGGKRPNRTTPGNGHWNATGSQRPIYSGGVLVGCVGTLVFYEASRKKKKEDVAAAGAEPAPPDEDNNNAKTDWTMYEYESLTSEAEFEAKRNGEGRIDELVLCTIQKKKHCEQSEEEKGKKRKKRKREDKEGTPSGGNSEKKGKRVRGNKGKDQESSSSHDGGSTEMKSSRAKGTNKQKGSPAVSTKRRNRKELVQEQEAYVKRSLMATQHQELMQAPLGAETVNTDPNMNLVHCSVKTSTLPLPSQEMMMLPPAGTQSDSVHPNYAMHHNFIPPMDISMLQAPTLREHFPYEQPYYYPQHMQLNTMAPPEVYNSGLDPEYSNYGCGSNDSHLLGTDMDYNDLRSFQSPTQPPDGVGDSTSTQGTSMPQPPGNNSFDSKPKYS